MKVTFGDLYEMISSLPKNTRIIISEEYPGVARQRFQVISRVGDDQFEYIEENYPMEFFRSHGALVEEIRGYRDDIEIKAHLYD